MEHPVLLPLYYFPPVSWFTALAAHPVAWLEQQEHYVKGTFRNRCHIASVSGVQRLTIPLRKGKNQQQPIREVRIAYDEPWQMQHWRSIGTAYGNSPFFEHYMDALRPFYQAKKYDLLWDWNYDLLRLSMRILKIKTEVRLTEKYAVQPDGIMDFRGNFNPKKLSNDVDCQALRYSQVFQDRLGFLPDMSVLDLIFCAGRMDI
ncbi:MAG: WbqC family protein [Bacteroidetes bacterium]|nr:WbqC family protein [Bacteroidota bacterium]